MKPLRPVSALAVAVCALTFGGCGPAAGDAEAECTDLFDSFCAQIDTCSFFTSHDDCMTTVREGLNCADAKDVGDDYDTCLDDIDAATCEGAGTLPASCEGVILF